MSDLTELFWSANLEELKQGFRRQDRQWICLKCGESFMEGKVYKKGGDMMDAKLSVEYHIREKHGSMFQVLLDMDKKCTGLTEHQKKLLTFFYRGDSDKEIKEKLENISASTIRQHRFALREKEKQSRIFLAIMELLKERPQWEDDFVPVHPTATMVDERYNVTLDENSKILKEFFPEGEGGPLKKFPKKEKLKLMILRNLITRFSPGREYSEKEVNTILKEAWHDYVTLRRYLIEYGFMDRKKDCSLYWLKS